MRYVRPLSLFQDVLMAHMKKRGRLFGFDVGDKYGGLAVSDSSNKNASPLNILLRKKTNIDLMASDLQSLAVQMKLFIDVLSKIGKHEGLCYTYWEENFTLKGQLVFPRLSKS